MSYKLVEDLQKKACPKVAVSQACRVLEVSRSGYYAYQAIIRQRLVRPAVRAQSVHLKAAFAASHKAYGSRRLRSAMGRHRVHTFLKLPLQLYRLRHELSLKTMARNCFCVL